MKLCEQGAITLALPWNIGAGGNVPSINISFPLLPWGAGTGGVIEGLLFESINSLAFSILKNPQGVDFSAIYKVNEYQIHIQNKKIYHLDDKSKYTIL